QVGNQIPVHEKVAVSSGHGKNRWPCARRLQRDDRALLPSELSSRAQKLDNFGLALAQVPTKILAQRTCRRIQTEALTVKFDEYVETAQCFEQLDHCHGLPASPSTGPHPAAALSTKAANVAAWAFSNIVSPVQSSGPTNSELPAA